MAGERGLRSVSQFAGARGSDEDAIVLLPVHPLGVVVVPLPLLFVGLCYLLQEGYASSFRELMETTDWASYGRKSGNEKCRDCMVHCGHEPTAVDQTFGSFKAFGETVMVTLPGAMLTVTL